MAQVTPPANGIVFTIRPDGSLRKQGDRAAERNRKEYEKPGAEGKRHGNQAFSFREFPGCRLSAVEFRGPLRAVDLSLFVAGRVSGRLPLGNAARLACQGKERSVAADFT